jgi:predicted DNA-binding transcriptional regulator AlpA
MQLVWPLIKLYGGEEGLNPNNSEGLQSIPMFCAENDISESFFYKLQAQGKAPRVIKLGARSFITPEARRVWREDLNKEEQV